MACNIEIKEQSRAMGNLSSLTSYKGDVYSGGMEIADMNSDMDVMITSNASLHGEDMWNEMLEQSPGSKVENKPEIAEKRRDFLNYVYEGWRK